MFFFFSFSLFFQFNGKFWQPSQFKPVQERFLKRNIFTKEFFFFLFFQPCETAAAESLRTGVVLLFFFPVGGKKKTTKYSDNLTSGHVLFSEQLSTVFHFCFFPVCSLLFTFSWHLSFVNGVASWLLIFFPQL